MTYVRKFLNKALLISSSFVAVTLYANEKTDYNMPVGVTEVSSKIFDLHMLIFWICVVIGIIVFSIMFWSLWKYRKSKGAVAADFDDNFWLDDCWSLCLDLSVEYGYAEVRYGN